MKTSKINIGQQVRGSKGNGTITAIITKSTGYVEVTYSNGTVKKEMAFNLTDENGETLKSAPKKTKTVDADFAAKNQAYWQNKELIARSNEHGRTNLSLDQLRKF